MVEVKLLLVKPFKHPKCIFPWSVQKIVHTKLSNCYRTTQLSYHDDIHSCYQWYTIIGCRYIIATTLHVQSWCTLHVLYVIGNIRYYWDSVDTGVCIEHTDYSVVGPLILYHVSPWCSNCPTHTEVLGTWLHHELMLQFTTCEYS